MRSLRTRLLISHSLPLIIIIILIGFSLDYILETQILLPGFADELSNEARLIAELTANQPDIWDNEQYAQNYLYRLEPILSPIVTLYDREGVFLGSTDQNLNSNNLANVEIVEIFEEDSLIQTVYSRQQKASVVDAFVVVRNDMQVIKGIIQMTYHLEDVFEQFLALRRVIMSVLAVGLFLGAGIALALALDLGRTLQKIKISIQQLARGEDVISPIEQGPEEFRDLIRTVNLLVSRLTTVENNRRILLANLVHEIGRPLGALLPAVQALRAGGLENEELSRDLLIGMEEEISVLRRLLDDLMGLYDQSEGSFIIKKELINLSDWLPTILSAHQEAANMKGLSWATNIEPDLPFLNIDPERMSQAIGNLVNNAIKFTPQGGSILIEVFESDNGIWIQVKDTGTGIPFEEKAFVFSPFFRGKHNKRFPQGMGLGLSIARDLISSHQGHLDFESTPGEGSCFSIWLPIS
ncbi:MAG: HAMP domain-containing histidine kinase [Anaerolineaceae bacterium]|nr:HAMP domain-containing histidine kinase [Anaerolineaceae bacterium]